MLELLLYILRIYIKNINILFIYGVTLLLDLNIRLRWTRDVKLVTGSEWEPKTRGRIGLPHRSVINRNAQFIVGKGEKGAWVEAQAK